jgi:hypothetical protein
MRKFLGRVSLMKIFLEPHRHGAVPKGALSLKISDTGSEK